MMRWYRILLAASVVAGSAALAGGCARREAAPDLSGRPASATLPARPGAGEPSAGGDREERYREAIRTAATNSAEVAALIPRKPTMGGSWRVGGKEDIHFLGNGQVALDYEDGHVAGRLVVKVEDPHDPKTWKVIRDEPQ